jgi:hypothetical protein
MHTKGERCTVGIVWGLLAQRLAACNIVGLMAGVESNIPFMSSTKIRRRTTSVLLLLTPKFLSSKNEIKISKQNLGNIKSCFGPSGQILVCCIPGE